MDHCCTVSDTRSSHPRKHPCPQCGVDCADVSADTIVHHLSQPWNWSPCADRYFFCASVDCKVVYFGSDGSMIMRDALRTRVGIKEYSDDALECYCFKLTRADLHKAPALRQFVMDKTRAGECSCEICNPSGRCCLKTMLKA